MSKNQKVWSGQQSEEGSQMKVEGEYMGKRDEMILEVAQKEQNKRVGYKTNRRSISKLGKHTRISKQWKQHYKSHSH